MTVPLSCARSQIQTRNLQSESTDLLSQPSASLLSESGNGRVVSLNCSVTSYAFWKTPKMPLSELASLGPS
jgi:hypothetical protein